MVGADVYTSDQRASDRRFGEVERDVEELRRQHERDVEDLRRQHAEAVKTLMEETKAIMQRLSVREEKAGEGRRQALYAGILPGVLFILSTAITILLAMRSGK
jgi:hypothetical protein